MKIYPDTSSMATDEMVRKWSSDCAISWDDDGQPVTAGEGGFICILAVVLFVLIAIGAYVAAVMA